jgi:hypothetical protein
VQQPAPGQELPQEVWKQQVEEVGSLEDISKVSDKEQLVACQVEEIKEFTPVAAEVPLVKDIEEEEEEESGSPASEPAGAAEGPRAGEIMVAGWLAARVQEWVAIGALAQVLAWVGNSVPIQLVRPIRKTQLSYSLQAEQQAWIKAEVEQSQRVGVVEWMGTGSKQPMGINFVCPIMCVPKKGPKHWQMVHDLHDLNCGLVPRTVHFKGLASLAQMASARWWLISFNLAQGYHHLLMEEDAHQLLGF